MIAPGKGLDRTPSDVHGQAFRRVIERLCEHSLSRLSESAHTDAVPDEDDRLRDASSDAGAGWSEDSTADTSWAEAAAPDDLSELAKDIAAYHREQRAARRLAALDRYVARPGAPILSVVLAVLAVGAIVATLLTVTRPHRGAALEGSAPLATPSVSDGARGGLLPAVTLQTPAGGTQASRELRPGVVALMSPSCNCNDLVVTLADNTATATRGRLALYAIAPEPQSADGDALSGRLPAGSAVYYDTDHALATTVGATGLTLVLVQPDGTIYDILPGITTTSADRLTTPLVTMLLHPAAG
jgi:hypothetical protein